MAVRKGAQYDQFDWPRTLRSQVSIYNKDWSTVSRVNIIDVIFRSSYFRGTRTHGNLGWTLINSLLLISFSFRLNTSPFLDGLTQHAIRSFYNKLQQRLALFVRSGKRFCFFFLFTISLTLCTQKFDEKPWSMLTFWSWTTFTLSWVVNYNSYLFLHFYHTPLLFLSLYLSFSPSLSLSHCLSLSVSLPFSVCFCLPIPSISLLLSILLFYFSLISCRALSLFLIIPDLITHHSAIIPSKYVMSCFHLFQILSSFLCL